MICKFYVKIYSSFAANVKIWKNNKIFFFRSRRENESDDNGLKGSV